MKKELHAVEFDGTTFGMSVDASTEAYKKFKKSVIKENATDYYGKEIALLTVHYILLAGIMEEARWLVSEKQLINKFMIDGFRSNEYIYVKYTDKPLDFRERFRLS